jgi:hypothetical protein
MYVKDRVIVMSGSWEKAHRRYALAHAIADDVLRAGPTAVRRREAEIDEVYGGLDQALRDIQYRWYLAFDAALDMAFEEGSSTDPARVWRSTTTTHRGYRAVLDAFDGHPALAAGDEHHSRRLFASTGVDQRTLGAPAATAACPGMRLLGRIRKPVVRTEQTA